MNRFTPFLDRAERQPIDLGTFAKPRLLDCSADFSLAECLLTFVIVAASLAAVALQVTA